MKKILYIILGVLVVAQLSVIFVMINGMEKTLRGGEAFNFLTRPIDPVDVFQGRYVRLAIKEGVIPLSEKDIKRAKGYYSYKRKRQSDIRTAYIMISNDTNGFAYFSSVSFEKPETNIYFETENWRYGGAVTSGLRQAKHTIRINPPFNRFYMDEEKAPETERAVRADSSNCWVKVRIINGKAAIENVYIKGEPVKSMLNDE